MEFTVKKFDVGSLKELIGALLEHGFDRDVIPEIVGEIVDDALDFTEIIKKPAPVGELIEALDGPIATGIARLILSFIKSDDKLVSFAQSRRAKLAVA